MEFPTREIIAQTPVVVVFPITLHDPDSPTAEIVMKRVRQSDCFMLFRIPTRVKTATY